MSGSGRPATTLLIVTVVVLCLAVGVGAGVLVYKASHKEANSSGGGSGGGIGQGTAPVSTVPVNTSIPKNETITLMKGTPLETSVYGMTSGDKRTNTPTVFVLGGVHGDESVGYLSAERLLKADVTRGTLMVSPHSNKVAINQGTRAGTTDLNRQFPGNAQGTNEARLAAEIFGLWQSRGVNLLLTCHATDNYHLAVSEKFGQTIIFDAPETRGLADQVAQEINQEITAPLEKYTVFIEPIATSATYEAYYRLGIPGYGLEVTTLMGQEKCIHYHLRLIQLFCEKVGVKVSNWGEILSGT